MKRSVKKIAGLGGGYRGIGIFLAFLGAGKDCDPYTSAQYKTPTIAVERHTVTSSVLSSPPKKHGRKRENVVVALGGSKRLSCPPPKYTSFVIPEDNSTLVLKINRRPRGNSTKNRR